MEIIIGEAIKIMTGYEMRSRQIKWFEDNGITCKVNVRGQVWTTRDWLNGLDKDTHAANDDSGFNMDFMKHG